MRLDSWIALFTTCLVGVVQSTDCVPSDEWGSLGSSSLEHPEVPVSDSNPCEPPSPPQQPQVPKDLREANIMLDARHKAKQILENASEYIGMGWGAGMIWGFSVLDEGGFRLALLAWGGVTALAAAAFAIVGVGLALYLTFKAVESVFQKKAKSTPSPKLMASLNQPVSLSVQQQVAYVEIHRLPDLYEGAAEQDYGVVMWGRLFQDFVIHFENAQDKAHKTVTDHIANRNVTAWPTLPLLPKLPHVPTKVDKLVYDRELNIWMRNNLMTIPGMMHAIESEYNDMHRRETLAEVYRRRNGTQFKESFDSVAFEKLSLTFLYRIGVPHFCVGQVPEAATVRKKMAPLRITQQVRADRQALVMKAHFEDRNAMTRAELL